MTIIRDHAVGVIHRLTHLHVFSSALFGIGAAANTSVRRLGGGGTGFCLVVRVSQLLCHFSGYKGILCIKLKPYSLVMR